MLANQMDKVLDAVGKLGLTVRGLYGEGTKASGNFFQVSNQVTLGRSEEDIIDNIERVINQIVVREENMRNSFLKRNREMLSDRVFRAYGTLKSARIITSSETIKLLSAIRLGVDMGFIKSLRENETALSAQKGMVVEIQGYEFYVHEEDGQKVLISTDIVDIISDGEALAILSKVLSATGFRNTKDGLPLIISSLSQSPRLFEDCSQNGFIGINKAFLKLYETNPAQRQYLEILLQVGLEHELRHELGGTDEFELIKIDAGRIVELCNANDMDVAGLIRSLKQNKIIDEDFEKIVTAHVGAAKEAFLWKNDPDYLRQRGLYSRSTSSAEALLDLAIRALNDFANINLQSEVGNGEVLSVGFGDNASEIVTLAETFKRSDVIHGVDWIGENVLKAKDGISREPYDIRSRIRLYHEDASNLQSVLPDDSIKMIFIDNVLVQENFGYDPHKMDLIINELSRVLAEGGYIIIFPKIEANDPIIQKFRDRGFEIISDTIYQGASRVYYGSFGLIVRKRRVEDVSKVGTEINPDVGTTEKININIYASDQEKMEHVFVFLAYNVLEKPHQFLGEVNRLSRENRVVVIAKDMDEANELKRQGFTEDIVDILIANEGYLREYSIKHINAKVSLAIGLNKVNIFGARLDTIFNLDRNLARAVLSGV